MRIVTPRPRRSLINITPLIDVVFILLIFFMVAGAIKQPEILPVELPRSESEQAGEVEDIVILIAEDGSVAFQGTLMPNDAALVQAATIWFAVRPDSSIQLKADSETDAARVIKVMELLREAGARFLVLVTVGGAPAE